MARVLLGWELGAGTGHSSRLRRIGARLSADGHQPIYVAQDIGAMPPGEVWQAPLWPAQLTILARPSTTTPATMGDILVALGLREPSALAVLIGAWDRLLAAIRPDVVAAEFAPALMLAAAGRVPVLGLGTAFGLPPADMDAFPSLTGAPALHDEAVLLADVNAALRANGRTPIAALPRIFTATRELAAAFAEFDPYRAWRKAPHGAPALPGAIPLAGPDRDELFIYMNGSQTRPGAFWQGLALSGMKVRIHDPRLSEADRALLRSAGFLVEDRPIPFADVARRSRLLLSHGGLGFATSALLAGLPQILIPFDIEKRLIARAVTDLDLGVEMQIGTVTAGQFAAALRHVAADEALLARSRAAAPHFRARVTANSEGQAADLLAKLAG
ncbi:MAG: hypothetical protein JWN59_1780 [Sphingomonas bacterium]|nr:hypothetical protein [Sphingomonas bacterium]